MAMKDKMSMNMFFRKKGASSAKPVFALMVSLMLSLMVGAMAVLADNGDGEIKSYEPQVIVEETTKDIVVTIHNDNPQNVNDPICLDEFIITAPDGWTGTATLKSISNMGAVITSNEADDGSYTELVADDQSLRIIPDYSDDGVELCPSGTTKIVISGLYAPDVPEGGEDSYFRVLTSDQDHNEPSDNHVRAHIEQDDSCGAADQDECSFMVMVTEAEALKVEYLQFTDIDNNVGGAEYQIEAKAWGAWGRLTELYVDSSSSMTVDVYMEKAGAGFSTSDYLIADDVSLSSGFNTIMLTDYSGVDVTGNVDEGYVKDSEQGGSNVYYYIDRVSGSGSLDIIGHADEDADESVDPTYTGTDFTNPPKEGTIISVDGPYERAFKIQLVREMNGKWVDVHEEGIPVHFTTNLGDLDKEMETTDVNGEVENHLLEDNDAGNAMVDICMADPIDCTEEHVGINAAGAHHFEITKGMTSTEVEAGEYQEIEVTVYDQYGNVISDTPDKPRVDFTILEEPDRDGLNDASLDDDTNPGPVEKTEDEKTKYGIADMYLMTSKIMGDHVIEVCVEDLGCKNTTIHGVLGQASSVDCHIVGNTEVHADQCFDVMVTVEDKNGNPLPQWESMVEVSLEDLNETPMGEFMHIYDTTLREENPPLPDGMPLMVTGKLNQATPAIQYAHANVTICGCGALGQFNIVCKSDTLEDDKETMDVINSDPACIDVEVEGREDECDDTMQLHTSILDTCGNKLVDQECATGGWASSCVKLETDCGTLSSNKTCVDLRNTGQAPLVDLDISGCGCGDINISVLDETDCCPSVYDSPLPMCEPLVIGKVGPATYMDMSIMPKASNQDNFWVSEETKLMLTLMDDCGQEVFCENRHVDVELQGEDCMDDSIQVDSPYHTMGEKECEFYDEPVHKVTIQNCRNDTKCNGTKEWTDLPEVSDLVVDKIAFEYNGPTTNVKACIYEETEEETGFQADGDFRWRCISLDTVPGVPYDDRHAHHNYGAWDNVHDENESRDGYGDVYYIELGDRITSYEVSNEYDNQRLGGSVVEAGDTKDFYIVLSSEGYNPCGVYDADYMFFQDYNSPDIISWGPDMNTYDTHVRDTLEGSEKYTHRNDEYMGEDPYPDTTAATPSYGFGDRILHNLKLTDGKAYMLFRDLVAETVNVHVKSSLPVVLNTMGYPVSSADQAEITFKTQPATQVVARNHGDMTEEQSDMMICDDAGYEPKYEFDPAYPKCQRCSYFNPDRECRPAMACSDEGYDVNLQVTDGFQNQVGIETEIQLHSCLEYPHYIYLGDTMLDTEENITVDLWDYLGLVHPDVHNTAEPRDVCFDMEKFTEAMQLILEDHMGPHDQYRKSFLDNPEFIDFVHEMVADKQVNFVESPGYPLYYDKEGNLVVKTDQNGRAKVRIESDDSSLFGMKSFDTSFRVFFVPHALDGDYFDVAFAPGEPDTWDIMAWPNNGIPADGEQESMLLIRKLDACGNPVAVTETARVTAESDSGRAIISRDFSGNNNYDNEVIGDLSDMSCKSIFPWFEDCSLQLINDVIENVTVTVQDENCVESGGYCTGFVPDDPTCEVYSTLEDCTANECRWVQEGDDCQVPDSTVVEFVGAPVQLKMTEIIHSDLIPADGWISFDGPNQMPSDACDPGMLRYCEYFHNEPEICHQQCVQYGNSGGWVTVQIQDKYGNRVTSYLGDGFKGDPGDVAGNPDYVAEKVCVALDDPRAFIQNYAHGFENLHMVHHSGQGAVYCGDLVYGMGAFKVSYWMLDMEGQPLDPREAHPHGSSPRHRHRHLRNQGPGL